MYRAKRLEAFSSNLLFLVSINILISTILVMSHLYADSIHKILWLLTIYLVSLARITIHFMVPNGHRHKLDFHFAGVVFAALVWALYPYLFHQDFDLREKVISIIIFCGMSGGSATLLSSDLRSAIAYTVITVFPYSVILLLSADNDESIIGLMSLGYGVSLCLSAARSNKFISSSIRNQLQVKELVEKLKLDVKNGADKISILEQRDSVTCLLNRTSFLEILSPDQGLIGAHVPKSKVIIYMHMRHFHLICSDYGHDYGDYVLQSIGKRLIEIENTYRIISSKWNGSGFLIYYSSEESEMDFDTICCILDSYLNTDIQLESIKISPSFYFGYYDFIAEQSLECAVRNAHLAMLEGKKRNIKFYEFDEGVKLGVVRAEYIFSNLKQAISNQELYLEYQPIVDIVTNEITGFESLIRWNHQGKLISPAEFIPIAEQRGLINEIGKYVLRTAIETLKKMNFDNENISVSINVSAIQFEDENFIPYFNLLVSDYSVAVDNIHLEITETAMIKDIDKLLITVRKLKEIGVKISIDDFGTGFSSIAVLKILDIDFIKVDKSYIDNITVNHRDKSIVSALKEMSRAIHVKVVAEGVEQEKQKCVLKDIGIDYFQGYLYSKPVRFEEAMLLLSK